MKVRGLNEPIQNIKFFKCSSFLYCHYFKNMGVIEVELLQILLPLIQGIKLPHMFKYLGLIGSRTPASIFPSAWKLSFSNHIESLSKIWNSLRKIY